MPHLKEEIETNKDSTPGMSNQDNKKMSLWHIDLTALAVCVAVSCVAYTLSLGPLLKQKSNLVTQRAESVVQRRNSTVLKATLRTLKHRAIKIREELESTDRTLESADRVNHHLARLTDLLSHCGLQINHVRAGQIQRGPNCSFIPIAVVGSGSYLECLSALHQLHRNIGDVSVVGFDLEGVPDKSEALGNFMLDMFWYTTPG